MQSNSPNAVLSLFLLLQLGGALAFALSGLYILYCFNRAASSVERMADAAEAWLALQHYQVAKNQATEQAPIAPAEPVEMAPVVIEKPFDAPNSASQNL